MDALALASQWDEDKVLPNPNGLYDWVRNAVSKEYVIASVGNVAETEGARWRRSITDPISYTGQLGPSCAVAQAEPAL